MKGFLRKCSLNWELYFEDADCSLHLRCFRILYLCVLTWGKASEWTCQGYKVYSDNVEGTASLSSVCVCFVSESQTTQQQQQQFVSMRLRKECISAAYWSTEQSLQPTASSCRKTYRKELLIEFAFAGNLSEIYSSRQQGRLVNIVISPSSVSSYKFICILRTFGLLM
jgi:hypothetical protein